MWDNLYNEQIITILHNHLSDGKIQNTDICAMEIALIAEQYSNDKNYFSPFAKKAQIQNQRHIGGKKDDITVIVAQVDISLYDIENKGHKDLL